MRTAAAVIAAGAAMICVGAAASEYYVRAGIGLDRPVGTAFTDGDCSSESPAARLEVAIECRPRFDFAGRANFLEPRRRQSVASDLSSLSGMLTAYIDLPGLGMPKFGPFGPFVEVGASIVRNGIGETRMVFPRTTTVVPARGRSGSPGW